MKQNHNSYIKFLFFLPNDYSKIFVLPFMFISIEKNIIPKTIRFDKLAYCELQRL